MNENWRDLCPTCKHFKKAADVYGSEDKRIEYGICNLIAGKDDYYGYASCYFKFRCKGTKYEYDITIPPDTSFLKEEPIKGCKRRIFYAIYRFLRELQRKL